MNVCFGMIGMALALSSASLTPTPGGPGYHVIKRVKIGGEGGWDYLTVDAGPRRLYISRGTHVMVLDADSASVVGDILNTPGVHGIAIANSLGKGFISNGGDNTVTVFDLKTLKELKRVAVGKRPDAIMFDPATRRIFTFNAGTSDATAIDAATDSVAGSVPLGGKPEFAVSDEKGNIFVNIEDKSEVIEFDAHALHVKNHWPIAPAEEPSGLAIDRKNHRIFSVGGNGKMSILDTTNGKVIATPAIGKGPDAAALDPESGFAFSSNGEDGTLTVIHEDSPTKFTVAETVQTAPGARTMALDSKTHHVILVTAKPQAAGAGANGRRRSYEPGSFEVIVVGR